MKIFNQLYESIEKNIIKKESDGVTSILCPFERLSKRFPGWVKGTYNLFTASSGIGKTKFTKFFTVTSIYEFVKKNPYVKVKIFYFALEENKETFWLSMLSSILSDRYNIVLSPHELLSLGKFNLDRDLLEKIKSVQEEINMMEENIEVIDNTFNPYGIYKKVRDYFDNPEIGEFEKFQTETGTINGKFKYKDDDQYVFVITDHVSLLVPDANGKFNQQNNLHDAMNYFSQEYCLKQICKRLGCIVINIQQQSAAKEQQEFHRGQTIEKKLEPSLDGLADNKLLARDADLVLGLFAPTRYEINEYRGYNITKLKDSYRSLIFLKDRNYGLANNYVHLYFNGATNMFKELPTKEQMSDEIYNQIANKQF